jgi:hypothetical protein
LRTGLGLARHAPGRDGGKELLGHAHAETAMIYTHVLNSGGWPVRSPLDQLQHPPR